MIPADFKQIHSLSSAYKLSEYESIVNYVLIKASTEIYEEKMHQYIQKNKEVEQKIQKDFVMIKKLFNTLQNTKIKQLCLITEAWCLDACILLPLLRAIEIVQPKIEIRIYLRDKNEDLMNLYLTNGSKAIPVVFGLDENGLEIFRWGPRSQKAKAIISPIMQEAYAIKYAALSEFYLKDLTLSIQEEWLDCIS